MTVDRDLLWAAWPEGYLILDGVGTVGGWRCVEVAPFGSVWSGRQVDGYRYAILGGDVQRDGDGLHERRSDWRLGMDTFRVSIDLGDLLPSLDPENDPATWACVKRDLAFATEMRDGAAGVAWDKTGDLTWGRVAVPNAPRSEAHAWRLWFSRPNGSPALLHHFRIAYIDDPATALAIGRAQLRQGAK